MESFSVSTVLGLDDWNAFERASRARRWSPPGIVRRLVLRAPMILIFVMLMAGLVWLRTDREMGVFAIGILGTLVLLMAQSRVAWRQFRPTPGGMFLGPVRYEFSADGMRITRTGSDGRLAWDKAQSVECTSGHVFVWLDQLTAYVIPARDLTAGLTPQIVGARLDAAIAEAKTGSNAPPLAAEDPGPPLAAEPLTAPTPTNLAQEIGAVGRLLLLMRADAARLTGSDGAIALLGLVALAIWLPLDWLIYPGPMEFMLEQAGGLACVIAGALALAWILSRLSMPRVEYRRVLLVVAGAMFIAIGGSAAFSTFSDNYFVSLAALLGFTAYAVLYFKRALLTLTGCLQTRALLVAAVAAFCFIVSLDRLYINPSLWVYTGDDDAETDAGTSYQDAWRRIADLQFEQQARLDTAVARIATHSATGAQVYFVGFAGYGEQRVFAQEIALAAKRVAERYGAGQRQIQLVNDRRDLEKQPFATARALRHTLVSLGKVMDRDDVLFLALSSHGDENATLSVSNVGMTPGELNVDQLVDALEESGIQWKVIVISACHAGSFIEKLAYEHTIVITASAADRTSFGCSDDRDLTYFGEAFYRDAWPKAASLRATFEAAKASIARREKAEGIAASEPQASFGVALEAKLAAPESR